MRIHSLIVTGFGPYAGTVRVDLDALSRDGLFLLYGPNGAGKTSLLDAIAFALYGRVPGARGQEKRLRSDHSDAATRTEVICEVTLRGQRLRITRRPEQVRPKARGVGTTADPALLRVQRLVAGGWEPVSSRLDEGGAYLRDQVGLTPEQFWQVVLLPQGEFAEFLRAGPDDRAKVLETLFDAQRFADAEAWLAEHARSARAGLAMAEGLVDRFVHRVGQAARGLSDPRFGKEVGAVPDAGKPDLVRRYVSCLLARATTQLAGAAAVDQATQRRLTAAQTGRERGRRAARAADHLLQLCRQRDALAARAGLIDQQRDRLAAALRAEALRPLLDGADAAAKLASEAAATLSAAWDAVVALDVEAERPVHRRLPDDAGSASTLRRWSRGLRDEVARLADLEDELEVVEADEQRLAQLGQAQARRQTCLDELGAICHRLPAALAALEGRRDASRAIAATAQAAATALDAAQAKLTAATRARELIGLVKSAEAAAHSSERAALEGKAHWLRLRETRLAGIAAELAAQLADGRPCPVCGSAQHPAPAEPTDSAVTAADERSAAQHQDQLETISRRSVTRLGQMRQELGVCRSVTSGAAVATVRREHAAARSARSAAQAAADDLPGLIAEHAELISGRDDLAIRIKELSEAQVADRAAATTLGEAIRCRRRRLEAARGTDPSLAGRRRRRAALADAAEAADLASLERARALAALSDSRVQLDKQVQCNGFPDPDAARGALLDEETRGSLAEAVRAHEDSRTGLAAEWNSAIVEFESALAELGRAGQAQMQRDGDWPTPLVARLVGALGDLRARHDRDHDGAVKAREAAVAAIDRARAIRGQLEELHVLIEQSLAGYEPLRLASDTATEIAELAAGRGANVRRMRLRAYVLAARLEQVAAAATTRLREMTSGRYGFVHSEELPGGHRRAGLSLDILDSYTGTQRPTKTLSGGESFMASLALALGLADVVTAESGGIVLDTLFVDEGFGSLDPESLDAVMTVLDDLRQGGRVVGIVSHVEELRTRVPMQLRIQTGRHGSTVGQRAISDEARLAG